MFDDFISDFRGFVEKAATQLNITDPAKKAKLEWLLVEALKIGATKCIVLPLEDQELFIRAIQSYLFEVQEKVL